MPPSVLVFFFFEDLDAITRPRPFFESELVLGTRGVINVVDVIWSSQHLCHYDTRASGLIFLVLTAIVASVDESCVSRAVVSTFEG